MKTPLRQGVEEYVEEAIRNYGVTWVVGRFAWIRGRSMKNLFLIFTVAFIAGCSAPTYNTGLAYCDESEQAYWVALNAEFVKFQETNSVIWLLFDDMFLERTLLSDDKWRTTVTTTFSDLNRLTRAMADLPAPETLEGVHLMAGEIEQATRLASTDYLRGIDDMNFKAFHDRDNPHLQRLADLVFELSDAFGRECTEAEIARNGFGYTMRPFWGYHPHTIPVREGGIGDYPTPRGNY